MLVSIGIYDRILHLTLRLLRLKFGLRNRIRISVCDLVDTFNFTALIQFRKTLFTENHNDFSINLVEHRKQTKIQI